MKKQKTRYKKTKAKLSKSLIRKKLKKSNVRLNKKQKIPKPATIEKLSSVALPEKKKRKRNPSRMYFTQDTEDAIVQYNIEEDDDLREQIFRDKIYFSFQKLVENIFNTFKFSYFETSPQDVQQECLTHLVANIQKYQKNKGKAFSYFSIIAKHYFILLNNTNYKKFNQNVEIGEDRDEHTVQLQHIDKHHSQQEMNDFIKLIVNFWESNIDKIFTKERDLNIANAVIELFRNSDRIDAYNKKALYLYIREMASCKTQQITKVINKMKEYHRDIHEAYQNDGDMVIE